jgi:hypothetical protein
MIRLRPDRGRLWPWALRSQFIRNVAKLQTWRALSSGIHSELRDQQSLELRHLALDGLLEGGEIARPTNH